VIVKFPSFRINKKLSKIGSVFLEEITFETDNSLAKSSVLETTNFINVYIFYKDKKNTLWHII
jgi:hypothetical protein